MKSFSILLLGLGLLAGCTGTEEKTGATTKPNAGEAFLAENAKKEGVKTTASGLQYKVIKSGTGESPKSTDTVKVHYHGTLIDGTVFDSSVQRGEPISFPVTGVIPGWVEALQLMKVGDKWQLFIPARLAYGERSPSPVIGPNSTLIFEVELLSIEK
jgi:FKBP-type peptidyl-prolyl cis-trans isomerase FklB